jgi:hypothetical protein
MLRLYNYLSPKITASPETAMQTSLLVIRHAHKGYPNSTPQAELDDPSFGRVMARDWLISEISSSDLVASCVVREALHCCFPVSHCAASHQEESWPTSSTQRHEGLFSFVASFGPHGDHCVQKQGYRLTNL